MKSSFMKLNHVSTFSGKGQFEMLGYGATPKNQDLRKEAFKMGLLVTQRVEISKHRGSRISD